MTYRRVKDPKGIVVLFRTHLRDGADVAAYERTSRREHTHVGLLSLFVPRRPDLRQAGGDLQWRWKPVQAVCDRMGVIRRATVWIANSKSISTNRPRVPTAGLWRGPAKP